MKEDSYRSQFRLPYSLYERLKSSADESRRSVNAELVARLEASFLGEPQRPSLSAQEAAMHTLTSLYQETLDRVAEWKRASSLSKMEEIELLHEEATANYLRHAIARAALPADERTKARKEPRPLGIDNDAFMAVKSAENTTPTTGRISRTKPKASDSNK